MRRLKALAVVKQRDLFTRERLHNLLIVFLLFLSFQFNFFRFAPSSFASFQYDSQALVIGRLAYSDYAGPFSERGLMGFANPIPENVDQNEYQYKIYNEHLSVDSFVPYQSHPGLQAFFYYVCLKLFPVKGLYAIFFLQCLISIFTAIVLFYWLNWLKREWGNVSFWVNFLFILSNIWIVLFARNLYWVLGALFLPFIISLLLCERQSREGNCSDIRIFLLLFIAFFIKGILTGFEYISTVCLMALVPFVYYAFRDNWSLRRFFRHIMIASFGIGTGCIAVACILISQLTGVKGSVKNAVMNLWYSFGKRSYGEFTSYTFDGAIDHSLKSNLWEVLQIYLKIPVWDPGNILPYGWLRNLFQLPFYYFLLLFLVLTIAIVLYWLKTKVYNRKIIAMTISLWCSLIASISWLILFKGHSYVHIHMNAIVWSMPFLLWGVAWMVSLKGFFKQGHID